MESTISRYIIDSMDEAMKSYTDTDEYTHPRHLINEKIASFRSTLSEEQQREFLDILNAIDNTNGKYVERAYSIGFVQGICFRKETVR